MKGGQKGERKGAGTVGGKERGKLVGGKERGRELGQMNPNEDQRVEITDRPDKGRQSESKSTSRLLSQLCRLDVLLVKEKRRQRGNY